MLHIEHVQEIDVVELHAKKERGDSFTLIDVREDNEYALCHLQGAKHIPLGQIPMSMDDLSKEEEIVIYCHHGGRSRQAAQYLKTKGFECVINVIGGIDQWAVQIDPTMSRY